MTYAHTLIGDFVKSCIEPEDADCSTYWHDEVLDQDDIDMAQESLFKVRRSAATLISRVLTKPAVGQEQVYGMEVSTGVIIECIRNVIGDQELS